MCCSPRALAPILLRRHPPDRSEPHRQGLSRILEDRTRRQRRLVLASSTDQQVAVRRPRRLPAATLANEAFRPTELHQKISTRPLGSKSGLQFGQRTGVILHDPLPQHIGLVESIEYPDSRIDGRTVGGLA